MKLLKNRIFAIILTAVVVVGCCAYGFLARPNETAADQTHLEYGKTNYSSYLDWIADEADLLSDDTEQLVASYMGALDHGWGSIVAVVTEDSGGTPILLAFGFVALLILIIAIASAASLGRGGRGGNSGGGSDNTVRHRRGGSTIFWGPTIFFPGRFGGPFGPPHGRPGRHRPPNHHNDHNRNGDDWPFRGGGGFGGGFGGGGFDGGDRGGGFGNSGGFGGGGFHGGDRGGGFGG